MGALGWKGGGLLAVFSFLFWSVSFMFVVKYTCVDVDLVCVCVCVHVLERKTERGGGGDFKQ